MSDFDDESELAAFTADERQADTVMLSTVDDAVAAIDSFRKSTLGSGRSFPVAPHATVAVTAAPKSPWIKLDRATVADSLEAMIRSPRSINQSALNLCGPASFFNIVIGRHPLAVVQAATTLFDTGACDLGGLHLQPQATLMTANYPDMATKMAQMAGKPSSQAEWMLLGALRNSTKVWWQPSWRGDPDQELAGMSRPEEVASWFTRTGFFSSVVDGGRWATNPGIPAAESLQLFRGTDNAILINANLLAAAGQSTFDNTFLLKAFPNHWVTLLSEVVVDVTQKSVRVSLWTWANSMLGLTIPLQAFLDNYYGAITTTLRPKSG